MARSLPDPPKLLAHTTFPFESSFVTNASFAVADSTVAPNIKFALWKDKKFVL